MEWETILQGGGMKIQKLKKKHLKIFYNAVFEEKKDSLIPLVDLLTRNEDISENKMAQLLNYELSFLRNNLYELHNHGLVHFKRKRDDEFGIYTYFWRLNTTHIKTITKQHLEERLAGLRRLIDNYTNRIYFTCENGCMMVPSDQCLEINYACPECGAILNEMKEDKGKIRALKEQIKATKEQLKEISVL